MEAITNHAIVSKVQDPDRSKTEAIFRQQGKYASGPDKVFFEKEETIQLLTDIWREVYRQGSTAGHLQDDKLVDLGECGPREGQVLVWR